MAELFRKTVTSAEFLAGLRSGLGALVVGLIGGGWWRRQTRESAPVAGWLLAAAALISLGAVRSVPQSILLGVAVLGIAGMTLSLFPRSDALYAAAALPGAWIITASIGTSYPQWVPWLVFGLVIAGGPLMAEADRVFSQPPLGPLMLAITVAGIYLVVPDTEGILVVLGAMAPVVLLGWPLGVARLGVAGSFMTVGVLAWVATQDGVGRPASIVGVVGCLGALALAPIAIRNARVSAIVLNRPVVVAVHFAVVAACSRVAGRRGDPVEAAMITALAWALGLVLIKGAMAAAPLTAEEGAGDLPVA